MKNSTGAKTRKQIAYEYNISAKTLNRRLKKYGIILPSGLIFPEWQKKIYKELGSPMLV